MIHKHFFVKLNSVVLAIATKIIVAAALLLSVSVAVAQDRQALQQSVELLSGVLEDALGFDQNQGFFGAMRGDIKHVYLEGQGIVIDIRTPLSSRRNHLGLSDLSLSMRDLEASARPGLVTPPSVPAAPQLSLDQVRPDANANGQLFEDLMARFADLDLSNIVRDATLRASASARSLRSLGEVDQESYQSLREEIEGLHGRLAEQMQQFEQVQQEMTATFKQRLEQAAAATGDIDLSSIEQRLEGITASAEGLRLQALGKANQLNERLQAARETASVQWAEEVDDLEDTLYSVMCDFGASLKSLPEDESVTLLLRGLGDEPNGESREHAPDKIHVLSLADIQACQSGQFAAAELANRANQYSY